MLWQLLWLFAAVKGRIVVARVPPHRYPDFFCATFQAGFHVVKCPQYRPFSAEYLRPG